MADLQTEIFTKVLPKMQSLTNLTFDDDANTAVEVAPATELSVTATIWNFIRDNPGCTARDISKVVPDEKGVATRINQLRARGYVETNFNAFPHTHKPVKEYKPLSKEERTKRMMVAREAWMKQVAEKKTVVKPKKKMGRPVQQKAAPAPKPARVVDLNNLSIVEARKLYDELKAIFGDK